MYLLSSIRGGLAVFTLGLSLVCQAAELPGLIDLSVGDATPVLRIYGRNAADYLGSENGNGLAFGDVNGDGFDDIIAGAYLADPRLPQATDTGAIYVVYGGATIPNTAVNLSFLSARRRATQVYGDDPRDSAGYSVASGDVNGDGYDDILIGALFADRIGSTSATTEFDTGKAYVIYGSPTRPGQIIDLSANPGTYGETRILGRSGLSNPASFTPGDLAGWSIGSGDINADGYGDVIVGARAADPNSLSDAGEVYVVYGSANIEGTTVDLRDTPSANRLVRILGGQAEGFLGWSVASGDANGDGFDDLFIGAYTAASSIGGATTGNTYVVFGATSLGPTIDLTPGFIPSNVTQIHGAHVRDYLGWSMGSGDVNADGYDDVIIGAVGLDRFAADSNHGGAYVVYGKKNLPSQIFLSTTDASTATLIEGRLASDQTGWSVAAGDADGDGLDDVVVGAISSDGPAGQDAGRFVVVYGSRLQGTAVVDLLDNTGTVRVTGENILDLLGYGVEAGADMDRDGYADSAGSAIYGDNPSLFTDNDSGAAYVVFGDGTAQTANFKEYFRSGIAPKRGVAGRLSPVARVWLEFNGGSSTSLASVTLTRSKDPISGFADPNKRDVAEALWQIHSDRTGYTTATVTFQYLPFETRGMNARGLRLFHASDPAGPWVQVASQTLNLARNEIHAEISSSSFNDRTYYTFSTTRADLPPVIDLDVPPGEESSPVARIYGDNQDDFLGSANGNGAAFGDINGDGYDDVILGATGTEPDGRTNAGDVYILYGTATLLAKTVDLNQPAGFYGETRILGQASEDQAGFSVACGDINADSFDDVIIGIPKSDLPGKTDAGEVQVIYGSPTLPGTTIELSQSSSPAGKLRVYGEKTGDNTGFSVGTGDINGDGVDDVLMGAPFADRGSAADVGKVYVVYGGVIASATVYLSDSTGTYGETRILGDDGGDLFGFSLASGQMDTDGIDEVIIGAIGGSPGGKINAGEVYVVQGSIDKPGVSILTGSIVDLDTNGAINTLVNEVLILGESAGDRAGFSVAAGDIDSNGYDDVVIGAIDADPSTGTDAGKAYLVYGDRQLEATTVNLADLTQNWMTQRTTKIMGANAEDLTGISVSAGDINGDGFDDVILGAIQADPSGGTNAGNVYILNGTESLHSRQIDSISDEANLTVWGDNANDLLGYGAESGADVDRNGFADFIASARLGDNPFLSPTDNNAGLGALIFGDGAADSAEVWEYFQESGIRRGMGGRLSPVVRTWIEFSPVLVPNPDIFGEFFIARVYRSNQVIHNLGNDTRSDLANVAWSIEGLWAPIITDPTVTVTFQYLDSEIVGLYEPGLRLYQGYPEGPWTDISGQILDTNRNTITFDRMHGKGYMYAIRLPQEIEIVGGPLLYGDLGFGCEEATKTLTIWNRGMGDLTFSGISIIGPASADFSIVAPTTGLLAPLPAGATKEVSISFLPSATGTRTAFLEVLSDDPDEPVSLVLLEGTGVDSRLEIIPGVVDFGEVEIGPPPQSSTRTVTLRSVGSTVYEFSRLAILGEASREYTIIAPVTGTTNPLAPGEERKLTLRFDPSSLRIRSATLAANSSSCTQATAEAILSGTGTGIAPELLVNPRILNFGGFDLCAGTSPPKAIRISNIGNLPLEWTGAGIALIGSGSADFVILTPIDTLVATAIAPDTSRTLLIAFRPSRLGPRNARLVITTNDGDEATFIVPLSGRGEETNILITPPEEELDFGDLSICGADSATMTLTIRNEGTRNLRFTGPGFAFEGPAASEYRILSPTGSALTGPLPPNRDRTLVIAFDPDAKSLRRARLVITTDDCHHPTVRIRLFGRGNDPEIEVHPTRLDFGVWDIADGQSATQTVYIRNRGNYFLNFTGVGFKFLGEASAEFVVVSPTPTLLAPIQAGATREMVVAFNPSSLRIRNATLAITTDDCDEATSSVILSGTGTGIAPEIEVLPKVLNFGNWNLSAGPSPSQTLVINNIGTIPLTFTAPGITRKGAHAADFLVLSATGPITSAGIPAGGSTVLTIAFDPSGRGRRGSNLLITTNDGDEPTVLIRMLGNGVDPDIEVTPEELNFGVLDVCGAVSATQTVTIRNSGNGPLSFTGEGIVFSGVGYADYRIVSPTTGATADIPEGGSRILEIVFDPVSYGRRKAEMLFLTNDFDESTVSITLNGRGLGPEIEIQPTDLEMNFGPVSLCGDTYASQSFTLKNKGNLPLEFEGPGIEFTGLARYDFYILSPTTGTYAPIPAGTSRQYEVAFDPTVRNLRRARMEIYTTDCDEPRLSVPLTGRGIAPEIDIPSDQLELEFDNTPTCTISAPTQIVTIRNRGNSTLNFLGTGIAFSLPDYSIALPVVDATAGIDAFQEREIVVEFNPTSAGRKKGTLLITTDDCDEGVIEIPLSGFGLGPEITVTPANVNFGDWSMTGGASATQTVTVRNAGNRTLNFTGIAIGGTHASDFILVSPTTGLTDPLPGLQSRALVLQFDPSVDGARSAFLTFTSDDCDEPVVQTPLAGNGTNPKEGEIAIQGNLLNGTSEVRSWRKYE